jgi:hypothetical protein
VDVTEAVLQVAGWVPEVFRARAEVTVEACLEWAR